MVSSVKAPATRNSLFVNKQYIRCGLLLEYGAGLCTEHLRIYSRLYGFWKILKQVCLFSSLSPDDLASFSFEYFLHRWTMDFPRLLCAPFGIFTSWFGLSVEFSSELRNLLYSSLVSLLVSSSNLNRFFSDCIFDRCFSILFICCITSLKNYKLTINVPV